MQFLTEIRKRARYLVQPLLALGLFSYFVYHALEGDRGALALMRLKAEIAEAESRRATVAAERKLWESRVSLLRPESLDRDMLDERARMLLNVGRRNDVVVLVPGGTARNAATGVAQR
ncbi:MAG: septum formation initiator family protein [Alphaproteobacteria bacterium]|nr:septum formation initiator family protein [Alphaproteobacteria bacterium]